VHLTRGLAYSVIRNSATRESIANLIGITNMHVANSSANVHVGA